MNRQAILRVLAGILALTVFTPAHADPMTREQGDAILDELRQIRKALEKQPPPAAPQALQSQNGKVAIEGAYALERGKAPLTMVIFTDYQCPFCKSFETQTFGEIKKNWIDTGKLRYVVRDHPLDFHPYAMQAAQATRCAREQGRFWELREKLVANAEQLQRDRLPEYAKQAGLDVGKFNACLDSGRYVEKIRAEVVEANGQGINGTPSFIIGRGDGRTVEGALLVGAMPYAVFDNKLNELLPK